MIQHCIRRDRQYGTDGEVVQSAFARTLAELVEQSARGPVLVHEHDALCGTLLAATRVRVLVALPRDVVNVSDVRAEDLPVKAGVFEEHFAAHIHC